MGCRSTVRLGLGHLCPPAVAACACTPGAAGVLVSARRRRHEQPVGAACSRPCLGQISLTRQRHIESLSNILTPTDVIIFAVTADTAAVLPAGLPCMSSAASAAHPAASKILAVQDEQIVLRIANHRTLRAFMSRRARPRCPAALTAVPAGQSRGS